MSGSSRPACNVDLWTDCIAGGLSCSAWQDVLRGAGFVDVLVGPPVDTFGGAPGEANARKFDVFGYVMVRPIWRTSLSRWGRLVTSFSAGWPDRSDRAASPGVHH
jgi:hypothetical protein